MRPCDRQNTLMPRQAPERAVSVVLLMYALCF